MKRVIRNSLRLRDLRKKQLTAGLKGELQRLPCSPPLTHWLMRSATPTFRPSASCFFSNNKIKNENDVTTKISPSIIRDGPWRRPQRWCSGSRLLRPQTGSSWTRRVQRQPSGPSAPECLICFPWRRSDKQKQQQTTGNAQHHQAAAEKNTKMLK